MLRSFLALALCSAAACALAQDIPDIMSDWKEVEAPPPPPLRTQGLIPVEVGRSTSLSFGVDPASITVGKDGVVRYVVVASSSTGTVNGIYEGIRCNTGQVKVYARHNPSSGWVPARESDWQDIYRVANSRYSLAIARGGACQEKSVNGSPAQIAQDLRAPADRRYERGGSNR
jgi:CNP1-like family